MYCTFSHWHNCNKFGGFQHRMYQILAYEMLDDKLQVIGCEQKGMCVLSYVQIRNLADKPVGGMGWKVIRYYAEMRLASASLSLVRNEDTPWVHAAVYCEMTKRDVSFRYRDQGKPSKHQGMKSDKKGSEKGQCRRAKMAWPRDWHCGTGCGKLLLLRLRKTRVLPRPDSKALHILMSARRCLYSTTGSTLFLDYSLILFLLFVLSCLFGYVSIPHISVWTMIQDFITRERTVTALTDWR